MADPLCNAGNGLLLLVSCFLLWLSKHFLLYQHGEFVQQSRASLVGDQLFYSADLNGVFQRDMVRRN